MKKSLAIILAMILLMTTVFFGCSKKGEDENPSEEESTSAQSDVSPSDEDSQNGELTTDGAQNDTQSTEGSTAPSSAEQDNGQVNGQQPNGSQPDQNNNGSVPNQNNSQTPGQNGTSDSSEAYRIKNYQQVFESGTYKMTLIMEEDGMEDMPATMAVKNGNVYMGMEMEGMSVKMIYVAENDTTYMVMDFLKMYCDVDASMLGEDMDFSQATEEFKIEVTGDIKVSQAELDGKKVTCESYVKDGTVVKFYFDENDVFVAREDIEPDGTTSMTKVSEFSAYVEDSLFEIPEGYSYMPLGWLMEMA